MSLMMVVVTLMFGVHVAKHIIGIISGDSIRLLSYLPDQAYSCSAQPYGF